MLIYFDMHIYTFRHEHIYTYLKLDFKDGRDLITQSPDGEGREDKGERLMGGVRSLRKQRGWSPGPRWRD